MASNKLRLYLRSGATPFAPSDIAGLSIWHDYSDEATVTLSATDITQITDKSGNTRTATFGVGDRPTYLSTGAGINNLRAAAFTKAESDQGTIANALNVAQNVAGFTHVFIIRPQDFTGGPYITRIFNNAGAQRNSLGFGSGGDVFTNTRRVDGDSVFVFTPTMLASIGTASFIAMVTDYTGRTVKVYMDAVSETSGTATWTSGSTSNTASSTAPLISGATMIGADIGEYIAYNVALTAGEVAQLRTYAQGKWATA